MTNGEKFPPISDGNELSKLASTEEIRRFLYLFV
nr:MAG TPA: hypothetical protein [Caudoviricetes sp.]